jgi:4-diphosphocytidyl-2-C-methyl-D-erythritol kinase
MRGESRKIVKYCSYAKVNLHLEVLGKRCDGYHELFTIMQLVDLCDIIQIQIIDSPSIEFHCPALDFLPVEENIAYRALRVFFDTFGIKCGIKVTIVKNIPIGAGLGGGSSNAGTLLGKLVEIFHITDSTSVFDIACDLGADVPFFFSGFRTAICEGKGEFLKPIRSCLPKYILIIWPGISLSTATVYTSGNFELTKEGQTLKIQRSVHDELHFHEYLNFCRNDLEPAVCSLCPVIRKIKEKLLSCGARVAMVSGSGSAVYGIFMTREKCIESSMAFTGIEGQTFVTLALS